MTNEPEPNTRAGEALKPFEREERFIVVKRKHLSIDQLDTLLNTLDENCIEPVECVVVESDWPEYETVWQMIEARATGNTRALPQPSELVDDDARLILRLAGVVNRLTPGAIERADLDGMAFTVREAEDRIAELSAQIAKLQARLEVVPGWSEDADGIACRNDTIKLQDECIAKLQADGDKLAGALEAFQRHYDLNDCDERCGALEVPISDLRRACQALTEWKDPKNA